MNGLVKCPSCNKQLCSLIVLNPESGVAGISSDDSVEIATDADGQTRIKCPRCMTVSYFDESFDLKETSESGD
jgi:phage FluMu protein Com